MLNFSTSIEQFTEQLSLEALGLNLQKKTVAIVTAFNEMSVANSGLEKIVQHVKSGVASADFNAVTFNLPCLCSDLTMGAEANKYVLPMRDNVADIVETFGALNNIDGFVFVANDAATVAGMLMGCLRVNIPSLFIGGGCMRTAEIGDKKMGFYSAYEQTGLLKSGKITLADLEKIQKDLVKGSGNASDNYSANSSLIIAEALGLSLPKASTAPSYEKERTDLAYKTGVTITEMVKNVMTPRSIASAEAIKTAVCVDIALGSSSTSIVNLLAIARETGNEISYEDICEWKSGVPRLVEISTKNQCFIEDFNAAGGVYAVIKQLVANGNCDGIYKIYDGKPMLLHTDELDFKPNDVIKDVKKKRQNPLKIVYGNLAENGAVAFLNEVPAFTGAAKVFENEESALDAISSRMVKAGDVVVIRNEGPESGPGMRDIYLPISMLVGLDLDKSVAVVTDGRAANISRGVVVGNVSGETADPKGLLDIIQNGDTIEINLQKERINLKLTAKDIEKRKKYLVPHRNDVSVFLQKYAKCVAPSHLGCYTNFKKD